MKAKSKISVERWEEVKLGEAINNMLIARASVIYTTLGDINGKLDVEYLLHYTNYDNANQHNSEATYMGYITFSGSINQKSGTFVLEDKGSYSSVGPISELTIKPYTGTGDFIGISGGGRYFSEGKNMIIEFDYTF